MRNTEYDELIKEVNTYGYKYKSIDDLLKIDKNDKVLIPVLLKWIDKFEDPDDKSWLARCLGVKGYTEATERLLKLYYELKGKSLDQWTVGDAICTISDKRYVDEYIKIISNKENGSSREMIIYGMGAYQEERVKQVLIELLDDEEVNGHVPFPLSKFKDIELIKYIEPMLNHKLAWKRKEAMKAIKKLEKLKNAKVESDKPKVKRSKKKVEKKVEYNVSDEKIKEFIEEINSYGYNFKDLEEIKFGTEDRKVIPTLIKWVDKTDCIAFKEKLAVYMRVENFEECIPILLKLFYEIKEEYEMSDFNVLNTIGVITNEKYIDEYVKIIRDKTNGYFRFIIIYHIWKYKDDRVREALIDLSQDEEVMKYAIYAMGEYEDVTLLPYITEHLSVRKNNIGRIAKKAMFKLDAIIREEEYKKIDDMLMELNSYGYEFKETKDLRNITKKDKILIPVIIKWINELNYEYNMIEIAEYLGIREFKEATKGLIALYDNLKIPEYKMRLTKTIGKILNEEYVDEYIRIINEAKNKEYCKTIIYYLGRYRSEKVKKVLLELLKDKKVNGYVIYAISQLRDVELIKNIEPFLKDKDSWKRKEAMKAIKKLEKLKNAKDTR